MNIIEAIKSRRSIRRYMNKDVKDEIIKDLIEAASYAPSAHNHQPWEFIITRNQEKLDKLATESTWAKFLTKTPVAIIVCARETEKRKVSTKQLLQYFSIQDTAAAIQNLLLAAHAKGLATCWIGDLKEDLIKELYSIPQEIHPVGIISLGYPEDNIKPRVPKRKALEEIIHFEKY